MVNNMVLKVRCIIENSMGYPKINDFKKKKIEGQTD